MRNIWIAHGRPRGNEFESYRNYKKAKRLFRNIQNEAFAHYHDEKLREIDSAAKCYFWKLWNRRSNRKRSLYREISTDDTITRDPFEIAEVFFGFYKKISNSDDERFNESFEQVADQVENSILNVTSM